VQFSEYTPDAFDGMQIDFIVSMRFHTEMSLSNEIDSLCQASTCYYTSKVVWVACSRVGRHSLSQRPLNSKICLHSDNIVADYLYSSLSSTDVLDKQWLVPKSLAQTEW
jgi:hypothetical protein